MNRQKFFDSLRDEVARIDKASVTKRREKLIEGFTNSDNPKAIIDGREIEIFNSNDYLGLRHNLQLKEAESEAGKRLGTGPGAVRFISGSFKIHRELEKKIAEFHQRDDAMVFSSAFATNLAVIFSLIKPQSKDSIVNGATLVISDELNHRSIIDGIRLANLDKEAKTIFKHLQASSLEEELSKNVGKFVRAVVITDGVFSMLGEYQDLAKIRQVVDKYDDKFDQGVLLIIDDCHGVAAFGRTGRGTEEITGVKADVLVGTLGKGFGADGGYVVADQTIIDYLRETAATYVYSNTITPATAAAALKAFEIVDSDEGRKLLENLRENINYFKDTVKKAGFNFAAESIHPIQALLIGDTKKTQELAKAMFDRGYFITNINYPVIPKGKDEIRVQLCATQNKKIINGFVTSLTEEGSKLGLINKAG